jgi:hypothetical protein
MTDKIIDVNEDNPNYFKALKLNQADELISENENMQENYGFEMIDPDTIRELKNGCVPK